MRYLLIAIIITLIFGLAFTAIKWPGGLHRTFSQHAVATRWSKIFYALLFLVTLPMLAWFVGAWLIPQKRLPDAFLWLTYIAALFQILCTWFPEVGGWRTIVHRMLAGVSAIAVLSLVVVIASSASLPILVRLVAWIGLSFMMLILAIALSHQNGYKWALLMQVGYYTVFFGVLLSVTYMS